MIYTGLYSVYAKIKNQLDKLFKQLSLLVGLLLFGLPQC